MYYSDDEYDENGCYSHYRSYSDSGSEGSVSDYHYRSNTGRTNTKRNNSNRQGNRRKNKPRRVPLSKQLNTAIKSGNWNTVQTLLDKNATIRQCDLNAAVLNKHKDILDALLNDGNYYDKSEIDLNPLLRSATVDGTEDIVYVLLKHGANANTRNKKNITVLSIALEKRFFKVAVALLWKGAKIDGTPIKYIIDWLYYLIEYDIRNIATTKKLLGTPRLNLNKANTERKTFLLFSLEKNNIRFVRELIERGAKVNGGTLDERQRLLCIAATYGYNEAITELLKKNDIDINKDDANGTSPLDLAILNKHKATVKLLLNNKASVTEKHLKTAIPNINKYQVFRITPKPDTTKGYMEILKMLLRGSNLSSISMDFFCWVVTLENTKIIQLLLGRGLVKDLSACNSKEKTPLSISINKKNVELTRILLSRGASLAKSGGVNACLCASVKALDIPMTQLLLGYLTEPIDTVQHEGYPLLHIAISSNSTQRSNNPWLNDGFSRDKNDHKRQMVEFLLDNNVDPDTQNVKGESALHCCIALGEHTFVEILIGANANVNKPNGLNKKTPIHIAAEKDDCHSARILLGADAFPNSTDNDGNTPLLSALISNRHSVQVVDSLLSSLSLKMPAANANIANKKGQTALGLAINNKHHELLLNLLQHGADPEQIGGHKKLLLLAVQNKLEELFFFLQKNGADVNQTLLRDKNTLDLSLANNALSFCDVLVRAGCDSKHPIEPEKMRALLEQSVTNKHYCLVGFFLKKGVLLYVNEAIELFSNLIIHNQPKALQTLLERGFVLTKIAYLKEHGQPHAPFCLTKNKSKPVQSVFYPSSRNETEESPVLFAADKKFREVLKLLIRYELTPKKEICNIMLPEDGKRSYGNHHPHRVYEKRSWYRIYKCGGYDGCRTMIERTQGYYSRREDNAVNSLIRQAGEEVKNEIRKERLLIWLKQVASVFHQGNRQSENLIPNIPCEIIYCILLHAVETEPTVQLSEVATIVGYATPIVSSVYTNYASLCKPCQELDVRALFDANGNMLDDQVHHLKNGSKIRIYIDDEPKLFELTSKYFADQEKQLLKETLNELYKLSTRGIYDSKPGHVFKNHIELRQAITPRN